MANAHRCRFKRLATNSYARLKIQIKNAPNGRFFELMAEWTGLEPATPGVTGRYSNQLNYHSAWLQRLTQCLWHFVQVLQNLATLRGFEPRYSP